MEKTVLTSFPADCYRAKDVAELYNSQWEIEFGFRNLKSSLLDNALVLRSRKVELVEQDEWGMSLACNLISREAPKAADKHKKALSEISFKFAFQFIATEMMVPENTVSSGTVLKRLEHLRGNPEALFIVKAASSGGGFSECLISLSCQRLHGAGCLPVNSAMTRQNPRYASCQLDVMPTVINAPPLRGIHHTTSF